MVTALRVGKERLLARRDPPHGTAQPARRPYDDRLLRIVLALVAEPAPHISRYDAQAAFVDTELFAYVATDVMRCLRAAIERVASGNATARFDGCAAKPVVDQLDRHAMRCTAHCGIGGCTIAARPLERLLAFDEGQRLVLHLDPLGCVFGLRARVGKDGGDR